jgi:hypothetical protein
MRVLVRVVAGSLDELDGGPHGLGQGRLSGDLFPLDHDGPGPLGHPLGHPAGTPPNDAWGPSPFGGPPGPLVPFMGRASPGMGPHPSGMPPQGLMGMDGVPMGMPRLMPPDEASQGYMDYPPASSHNHVEVY